MTTPGEKLKVTSTDLRIKAHGIDMAHGEIQGATSKADVGLHGEVGGWVGDSKKALEKAIDELTEHSKALVEGLEAQSKRLDHAADRYADTERRNAERLREAGGDSTSPQLNMGH